MDGWVAIAGILLLGLSWFRRRYAKRRLQEELRGMRQAEYRRQRPSNPDRWPLRDGNGQAIKRAQRGSEILQVVFSLDRPHPPIRVRQRR
jgi:hypothetical protein